MKPRNFVTVNTMLADDPITGSLDSGTWEFLTKFILATDRHHMIGPLDGTTPQTLAFSIRTRLFTTQQAFQAWNVPRLSKALQHLLALGVVEKHSHRMRLFLKVGEAYRYTKGDDVLGVRDDDDPQQTLPLAVPPALLPPPKSHSNANRVEQSKALRIEKTRDACAGEDSGNRLEQQFREFQQKTTALEAAKPPPTEARPPQGSRFVTTSKAFLDDERWKRFLKTLGDKERVENGKLWEKRWKIDADGLWACASDWISNEQRGNFGAVATKYFADRHKEDAA
jgi:hypothetical protein